MSNTELFPFNELLGVLFASDMDDSSIESVKSDASGFLKSTFNIDFTDELKLVENTSDTVHLSLPYYEVLNNMSAEQLSESAIGHVSGGEIFITIGALIGTAIGVTATVGMAAGAGLCATIVAGGVVGGAVGTAVTAGAVAGAVVGTDKARHNREHGGK